MPVINFRRTPAQLGTIRMGKKGDRNQPQRLETWRLTSENKLPIEAAANLYGGTVQRWGEEWEVITEVKSLPCMIAPVDLSQWYELWSGGGCQRRCDGVDCTVPAKDSFNTVSCLCDPDKRECDIHTRLSVYLHQLPGLGIWRLNTQGYHAACELPDVVGLLVSMVREGARIEATLNIEQREKKVPGQATKKFPVPTLSVPVALQSLLTGEVPQALIAPAAELPAPHRTEPPARAEAPARAETQERPIDAAARVYKSLGGTKDELLQYLQAVLGPEITKPTAVTPREWEVFRSALETQGLPDLAGDADMQDSLEYE